MQVVARVDGLNELCAKYDKMPSEIDKGVRKASAEVSGLVRRELSATLKTFPRHAAGTPTPSPPGAPPAQVTTKLRTSIKEEPVKRIGFGHYERSVLPDMHYAIFQELGTSRMPARPFVMPTFNRVFNTGIANRVYEDALRAILTAK